MNWVEDIFIYIYGSLELLLKIYKWKYVGKNQPVQKWMSDTIIHYLRIFNDQ